MRWLAVVVVAACGRLDFAEVAHDGGRDGKLGNDCWQAWTDGTIRFTTPVHLAELEAGTSVANPVLSADGLELFFDRIDTGFDLFSAVRDARGLPWHSIQRLDALDSPADEGRASGVDGLVAFTSTRSGTSRLYTTTRSAGGFTPPVTDLVAAINTAQSDPYDPELSASGLHLYDAPSSGATQAIAMSSRTANTDGFGSPVVLTELSISTAVGDPAVSPDESVIVFSSGTSPDANDLYYAVRGLSVPPSAFGTPRRVPDVNDPTADDHDAEVANDGCELLWFSNRNGADGIYAAFAQ